MHFAEYDPYTTKTKDGRICLQRSLYSSFQVFWSKKDTVEMAKAKTVEMAKAKKDTAEMAKEENCQEDVMIVFGTNK